MKEPIDLDRARRIEGIFDRLRDRLSKSPRLANRTKAMLEGDLPCPDLEKEDHDRSTNDDPPTR